MDTMVHRAVVHRDIKEPKNVKLLFDVLRFEPAAIHRAVLFVTNNALVCETPEDASRVAYDLDRNKNSRYDVSAPLLLLHVVATTTNTALHCRHHRAFTTVDYRCRFLLSLLRSAWTTLSTTVTDLSGY